MPLEDKSLLFVNGV
uniref:Uncharacterized protein n=1 Tax=Lepeophtheirus salmonis TaxID=72036 RepID=A0A0K2TEN1_LEPSM